VPGATHASQFEKKNNLSGGGQQVVHPLIFEKK
jgi:hypothetical protein